MIDVEDFRPFNKRYGHDTGDYVLSEIGLLIRKTIRPGDIACHYGAEEFALLLSGADPRKPRPYQSIRAAL